MKNIITTLLLLSALSIFCIFIKVKEDTKIILSVETPTRLTIINSNNKKHSKPESVCLKDVETFSIENSEELYEKLGKEFNLSKSDIISLGYLAQEYSQKALSKGVIKITNVKNNNECKFADIKISNSDYKQFLLNSGFAIVNNKIVNQEKFNKNIKKARSLDLVILNHNSNKYHTLECPYGSISHDKVLLPKNQLPQEAQPCKYCNLNKTKTDNSNSNLKLVAPQLKNSSDNIITYLTDYTKQLTSNKDCQSNVCKDLVSRINNAKTSIDIAAYGYSDIPAITKALQSAVNRNIAIRYIYDENFESSKNHYKDNDKIIKLSTKYRSDKTNSKALTNMLMHNKFIIFDKQTVYTGSMNLSPSGLSNFDVNSIVIINSKDIAKLYTKEFEHMLNGKFHTNKVKHNTPRNFKIDSSEVEIYFSPTDKTSIRIIELIKNAKTYVYMPTFLITHTDISNELIKAKERGVDVRIIIDANSINTRNTKHPKLRENGILVKTENYAGKLHSKLIIIDDTYIISGSMNFSNSGENKNDENLVIIKNSKIAKAHKNFFLYLWTQIPNKYLKENAKPEGWDSIGSCTDDIDNNFNGKIDKEEYSCQIKNN